MATRATARALAACWLGSIIALNLWAVWHRLAAQHGHGWARLTVAISFAATALLLSNQQGQRRNARLFYVLTVAYTIDQMGLRDIGQVQPTYGWR